MFHADRFAVATMSLPMFPGAHQRMLQYWQLIGIVADVVQKTINERFSDLSASNADWSSYGEASLVTRHARDQILSVVDCFRQIAELRKLPVETIGSRFGGIPAGLPEIQIPRFRPEPRSETVMLFALCRRIITESDGSSSAATASTTTASA